MPNKTVTVYTTAIKSNIPIVSHTPAGNLITLATASDKSGVASEKVVAVPASKAKMAIKSISFPRGHLFFPQEAACRPPKIFVSRARAHEA